MVRDCQSKCRRDCSGAVWREPPVVELQPGKPGRSFLLTQYVWHIQMLVSGCITMSSAPGQWMLHRFRPQKLGVWLRGRPSANVVRKAKESQLHGQAPHSQRPGAQPAHLESRGSKTNIGCSFGVLPTVNLVSSPNVERKTRSLTVNEVESSRERTPEYCTNSNSGRCCGGVRARKQRSEGGHYRPFWWDSLLVWFFFFVLPQN